MLRTTLCSVLLLVACRSPAEAPFDVDITFAVTGGDGIDGQATVFLAARKRGRTAIVDAWQDGAGEGERYGRHRFPRGCTAEAIADYYVGLLRNAGWTDADVRIGGATLTLLGVEAAASGADREGIRVAVDRRRS